MIKRIYCTTLILLSISTGILAQSRCDCYDRLFNLASHYENNNDLQQAINVYKDAITFLDADNNSSYWQPYKYIAIDYHLLKNYDSAAVWAIKSIERGIGSDVFKDEYPETYAKIPVSYRKNWPDLGKNVDWDLYTRTQQTQGYDLLSRSNKTFNSGEWLDDSLKSDKIAIQNSFIRLVDSLSYLQMINVLDKDGWPTYDKVGFHDAISIGTIMHVSRYPGMGDSLLNRLIKYSNNCAPIPKSRILFIMDNQKFIREMDLVTKKMGKTYAGTYGAKRYFNIEDITKADSIRFVYNKLRLKEEVVAPETLPDNYKPTPYPKNYFCLQKYKLD